MEREIWRYTSSASLLPEERIAAAGHGDGLDFAGGMMGGGCEGEGVEPWYAAGRLGRQPLRMAVGVARELGRRRARHLLGEDCCGRGFWEAAGESRRIQRQRERPAAAGFPTRGHRASLR